MRLRLLGAMVVVFVLGLAAALVSYRMEVHRITSNLRASTLENQARELLDAMRVGKDGSVQVHAPADWRAVYRSPSRRFVYTVFDAAHRPLGWSANLAAPLPYIPVDSRGTLGPVELIGAGAERRAIVAARGPGGTTVLVGRGDRDRDELVDSLFEEGSEQLTVIVPFAILALVLI
ncbi:MAG TPA: sensor histidine kinase N-terminal domain-containing protein, partial [Steroidobacteraceae bacterium]|nr:sensor histidine kinase N-terminal domain-containing protein [Steroidobacteraceae bacterium]